MTFSPPVSDTQAEAPAMPTVSMDPLTSAHPLSSGGKAYSAPIRGTTQRPVFTPEHSRAPREIVPESVAFLDTHGQLQRDQDRRERQAAADAERIAALPTREELLGRRIAALEADLNALRVTVAHIEKWRAQVEGSRGRSRHLDPPEAA